MTRESFTCNLLCCLLNVVIGLGFMKGPAFHSHAKNKFHLEPVALEVDLQQ